MLKKLGSVVAVAVVSLAVSATSFASSLEIARLGNFAVPTQERSMINQSLNISILEDGTAEIELTTMGSKQKLSYTLSFAVLQSLKSEISRLSNAEIKTTVAHYVCFSNFSSFSKLSLLVRQGYNVPSNSFDGELAPVLARNGCQDPVSINPVEVNDTESAFELRGQLKSLALQLITK